MKKLLIVTLVLLAQISIAQVHKNLGDFTSVNVYDRISLELVPADENKISITGAKAKDVEVVNKNGDLHIRMKLEKLLQGESVSAILYYKTINSVDASEGSLLSSSRTIKQPTFNVSAKEGAEIRLTLDVDTANIKVVTGGIVNLTGDAQTQDISMGTGGILNAQRFITEQTNISINAGGEAEIHATKMVEAKVRAGGDIKVYGNPRVDEKIVLGGTVTKVNE
jgi:hypothetical protein